ncbi:MAG: hypothetical protein IJD57_04235 [Candidatus Gastranaerophilales bacterium]|nr:hypothetical protein [Candidatus Gastranaerophilales bacterium]
MMIFLGHSAFAMYCWEEMSGAFNYESKMKDKLGASNIVKVNSVLSAMGGYNKYCYRACSTYSSSGSCVGYSVMCTTEAELTYQVKLFGTNFPDYPDTVMISNTATDKPAAFTTQPGYAEATIYSYYNVNTYSLTNNSSVRSQKYTTLLNPYYIHTFCTTVGSGGGGGAAGAAVNYIIKAG